METEFKIYGYLIRFTKREQIKAIGVPLLDHVAERLSLQHSLVRRVHCVTASVSLERSIWRFT